MPKWATCRSSRRSAGFTLLELIVVLAILGAATALAMPNLQNFYASLTRRTDYELALDQLNRLGATALTSGQNLVIWPAQAEGADDEEAALADSLVRYQRHQLDLPPGWRLELDRPLLVRANGVCLGARLTLTDASGRRFEHDLQAPFCRV